MMLSTKYLSKHNIHANDGDIGRVHGFLFDERHWLLRYLVVDTSKWLPGRKVLIATSQIGEADRETKTLSVDLTKQQIKDSPDIISHQPVSRKQEAELHKYYNWAPYWGAGYGPIMTPYEPVIPPAREELQQAKEKETPAEQQGDEQENDSHLRDTSEVISYNIHAVDGNIGHVEDFIIDNTNWLILHMIVDTKKILPGKKVIVPTEWVKEISWFEKEVVVDVQKEQVKNSPEYDPEQGLDRQHEEKVYDHYGKRKYWI